jgi:hypothetical protein
MSIDDGSACSGDMYAGVPTIAPTLSKVFILEGETEVRHARFACGVDQNVRGLDVAVDQPSSVGVVQGVGDGGNQLRRIPEGRSTLAHPDRQVAAFDKLRDHEAEPVFSATHIEDRHDVRMVEFGEDSGFNKERLDIKGASDSFGVRHLDGHRAIQVIVVRTINRTEPAVAQPMDDPIAPNPGRLGGVPGLVDGNVSRDWGRPS